MFWPMSSCIANVHSIQGLKQKCSNTDSRVKDWLGPLKTRIGVLGWSGELRQRAFVGVPNIPKRTPTSARTRLPELDVDVPPTRGPAHGHTTADLGLPGAHELPSWVHLFFSTTKTDAVSARPSGDGAGVVRHGNLATFRAEHCAT